MADHECEECGKPISPQQAADSYHATFKAGESEKRLCRKHLDKELRG